jgi:hypothetical protein
MRQRFAAEGGMADANEAPNSVKRDAALAEIAEEITGQPFAAPRGWISALPDFALAITFLSAWIAPNAVHPGTVSHLMLVMLLEFIIVHSSAFMGNIAVSTGTRQAKVTAMIGLGGFYTLFVGGFSLAFHSVWPLISFWALMLNRMLGVIVGQAPAAEQKAFVQRSWATSVLLYMGACFFTILVPLPRFGLTNEVVWSLHLPGSGLWVSQPHRVMAFGFLYFTGVALSELGGHAWLKLPGASSAAAEKRAA